MNSALLRSPTESDTSLLNNSMFGKFKGFTLRPLPTAAAVSTHLGAPNVAFVHPVTKTPEENTLGVPIRSAPPPPKPPSSEITQNTTDVKPSKVKQNGTLPNMPKTSPSPPPPPHNLNSRSAPALPPPNPGFNARPIISSPILEASTCTAKELISPLKTPGSAVPVRPAPTSPPVPPHADPKFNQTNQNVISSVSNNSVNNSSGGGEKSFKDGTIKRIASFLKKDDSTSQKHPQKIKPVIDREKLKNIEISAPIPVVDFTSDSEEGQMVARTQSMRDTSSTPKKPSIQSFGSMRQPSGVNRPKSMVGSRPKSPPPRPPAPPGITNLKTIVSPGFPNSNDTKRLLNAQQQNEYDDCEAVEVPLANISEENSPTGSDNIYSVIEENPKLLDTNDPSIPNITGSNDSMGLLGEIVSEIEKRNVDSIYSASTLRKKKAVDNQGLYTNTSESNDYSESDYLKSNGSTTSSGYLRPSSVNTPVARVAPTRPDQPPIIPATNITNSASGVTNSFSSFKPKPSIQPTTKSTNSVKSLESKPTSLNKTTTSMLNRTKPSSVSGKVSSSDSVRKRSPSPVGQKTTNSVTTNRGRPSITSTNNTSSSLRKNSIGDSKTTSTTGNQSQKPKPFSKPSSIGSKSQSINGASNTESKLNRQNSDTTKPPLANTGISLNKRSKSSLADQIASVHRKSSAVTTSINSNDSIANSNSNGSNNISSSSSNKILNAAARPTPGKVSNVASLQQKFENAAANKSSTSSSSSTTNSMTAKK